MRLRIALSAVVLAVLVPPTKANATEAGPWGLARGEWYFNTEASTFTANTFHDPNGNRLDDGSRLEQRQLRLYGEAGWKKDLTVVFALPALSVTRRDPPVQGTATGFQDILLGMRWNQTNGRSALALELDWSGPAGYNRSLGYMGQSLGDGLQQLSLEVAAGTAIQSRGFVQGSLGYGYRYLGIGKHDDGPVTDPQHAAKYTWSDRVLATADLALWLGPSVLASGRYRGEITVANGVLVADSDVHLAGVQVLYRIDDRLDAFAGSWSTASGMNTPHYDEVYVGFAFHRTALNRLQGFLGSKPLP